jgi:hypothetical protein
LHHNVKQINQVVLTSASWAATGPCPEARIGLLAFGDDGIAVDHHPQRADPDERVLVGVSSKVARSRKIRGLRGPGSALKSLL